VPTVLEAQNPQRFKVTAFLSGIWNPSKREVHPISRLRRKHGRETDILPFQVPPRLFRELNA
jgi:hypothetical protein